jgi:hypothetical protein
LAGRGASGAFTSSQVRKPGAGVGLVSVLLHPGNNAAAITNSAANPQYHSIDFVAGMKNAPIPMCQ